MSFSVGPSSDLIPRASLDGLPPELKRRIVELCAEQDERFKQWTHHFEEQVEQSAGLEMAGELDDLTVKASDTDQPIFQYFISPTRAHHFVRLELDPTPESVLKSFLPLLRNLTGIRHVVIHQQALNGAVGSLGKIQSRTYSFGTPSSFAARFLRAVLNEVTSSELFLSHEASVLEVLACAPALRSLAIDLEAHPSPAVTIKRVLAAARELRSFELRVSMSDFSNDLDLSTATPRSIQAPSLTTLTFRGRVIPSSFFAFAAVFSSTLKGLSLVTTRDSLREPFPGFASLSFPVLTKFRISGHSDNLGGILSSLTPSALPRLEDLCVDAHGIEDLEEGVELVPILSQHLTSPTRALRSLHVFDLSYPITAPDKHFLRAWSSSNQLDLQTDPSEPYPNLVFFHDEPNYGLSAAHKDDLVSSVDRTADFLASWHAQARRAPRQEEYARLAAVLRAAELARVVAET